MIEAKLSPAFPQLPTGDIEKTAEFFVHKLGFEVIAKYVDQKFLIVRRGPAEIHFWQAETEAGATQLGSESSKDINSLDAQHKIRHTACSVFARTELELLELYFTPRTVPILWTLREKNSTSG